MIRLSTTLQKLKKEKREASRKAGRAGLGASEEEEEEDQDAMLNSPTKAENLVSISIGDNNAKPAAEKRSLATTPGAGGEGAGGGAEDVPFGTLAGDDDGDGGGAGGAGGNASGALGPDPFTTNAMLTAGARPQALQ
eukprot:SAG22_NODE_3178_length_1873_cov_3.230552_1_plen_136_part_10